MIAHDSLHLQCPYFSTENIFDLFFMWLVHLSWISPHEMRSQPDRKRTYFRGSFSCNNEITKEVDTKRNLAEREVTSRR